MRWAGSSSSRWCRCWWGGGGGGTEHSQKSRKGDREYFRLKRKYSLSPFCSVGAGVAVPRRGGLGLRRILLAQPDRQQAQRDDREEFALPVLERLEPELRVAGVVRQRRRRLAGRALLFGVVAPAGDEVQYRAGREQQQQRDRQRVLVEPLPCAADTHRPRLLRLRHLRLRRFLVRVE